MPDKPEFGPTGRKIVYNKDGTPCRSCNSLLDFQLATNGPKTGTKVAGASAVAAATAVAAKEDSKKDTLELPPDVEQLGRSSWTLLHSIAAHYPKAPEASKQADMKQFVKLFGNFYPCWFCADDFKDYIKKNEPKVESQDEFGKWLCDAHNAVNVKLGKPEFDCNLWKKRWGE